MGSLRLYFLVAKLYHAQQSALSGSSVHTNEVSALVQFRHGGHAQVSALGSLVIVSQLNIGIHQASLQCMTVYT